MLKALANFRTIKRILTFNQKRIIRKPHKKINLVLSTARTGSTWLFLHFHQSVNDICYEPYNSDDSRPEYKAIASAVKFKERIKDPVRYFAFLSQHGPVDMKLEITPKSVLNAVFKNADKFNCAILRRENMLQQYISRITAHRSKVFYSENPKKEESPLFVNPKEFEAWRQEIDALYTMAARAMKNHKIIYYEDLNPSIAANFFQAEIRFTPAIAKLHTDYSFVENRAELEKLYPQWKLPAIGTMASLPAHGGSGLVNRFIPEEQKDSYLAKSARAKAYKIANGDLATFYRIADGTLSPLEGPMDRREFYGVLDHEYIERNGKKYAWTIPVAFAVSKKESENFTPGETVTVENERGVAVGLLQINDIYHFDKEKYNRIVYGTDRTDHPGARIVDEGKREYLLGGRILAFAKDKDPRYGKYILSPLECRALFQKKGWERIVAFQTRNPLHRAHEYAMVFSLEKLTKEGFFTGAVLNPLVGKTKFDDIPADVRMRTYEVLLDNRLLGLGDSDEEFWKNKGYDLSDQILLIGLEMKMFYAGPKEAVMHAIYRQNMGFTDIIIGRKHADAPFDDNTPLWGDFDAQDKFSQLKGELLIKPLKVGFAAYFKELGRVGLVDEYKDKGYSEIKIAGKELREKLQKGEPVDERIMRREVAHILSDSYRNNIAELRSDIKSRNLTWHESGISKEMRQALNGHKGACLWLTGLPCSGKSTLAAELQKALFKMGCQVFILDGDNIRHGLNKDLGFSAQDRAENIRRIGEVAKLFSEAGFLVITAFISPYRKDRDDARSIFQKGDFIEIFVSASLAVCETRDVKGLYKKARLGEIKEFTGISSPYEEPRNPELIIDTASLTKEESAAGILRYLMGKDYIQNNKKRGLP